MKKNSKYIIVGLLFLIILILGFSFLNSSKDNETLTTIYNEENQVDLESDNKLNTEAPILKDETNLVVEDTKEITKNIRTSLTVSDKEYETSIEEGASVFDLMQKLQNENEGTDNNHFDFKYTKHAGLGNFITEINGAKGTVGKYWIYYVNDKEASVGVSNYILKEGDSILWKQE